MNNTARSAVFAAVLLCLGAAAPAQAAPSKSPIAWQMASSDAEVDKAFALARKTGKPVFLYWGAVWCPPCNQVKATLFSRPDFAERTRAFVPVYVDGDKPGAQKVASRFKVSGYPTMIVFKPDGSEITRLPGEVDPQRYLLTLTSALNAQSPVKDLVQRGLAKQPLSPEQWRMLAFYSWDTDEQQVLKSNELAARLTELAVAVPADLAGVRQRLAFKGIVARAREKASDAALREADKRTIEAMLADTQNARELQDLLIFYADTVVKYVAPDAAARSALAGKWDSALAKVLENSSLSYGEQVDGLDSRVAMWKHMEGETLSPARRDQVIKEVTRIVSQSRDKYERQAVIPSAAHVLAQAGLMEASDAMLKAELPRAVAPYYHMLGLAGNAKKRGDKAAALQWYEQAWRKSEGPATRIQWGATYVRNLVELAPTDVKAVSGAASTIISELQPKNETFFERNQRSLQRMAKSLSDWQGTDAGRTQAVAKLKEQLARTCGKLPANDPGRANCNSVFTPAASS